MQRRCGGGGVPTARLWALGVVEIAVKLDQGLRALG